MKTLYSWIVIYEQGNDIIFIMEDIIYTCNIVLLQNIRSQTHKPDITTTHQPFTCKQAVSSFWNATKFELSRLIFVGNLVWSYPKSQHASANQFGCMGINKYCTSTELDIKVYYYLRNGNIPLGMQPCGILHSSPVIEANVHHVVDRLE